MSTPILTTKLYIPPPRPDLVPRARLLDRMNQGMHRKLTLVSAPAGFGKTTLVTAWIRDRARPVAWLALDTGDNDFTLFVTYLVAAMQSVVADWGARSTAILQDTDRPQPDALLTTLLNELAAVPDEFVLVLDDYHAIEAKAVDELLAFLVEYMPAHMHLVITTREDPPIPLARLRARGQLAEIRAADLRFTADEAAAFLNQAMGLTLSPEEIAALETRTEGWIAGLQLAALSMQGRRDVHGFVEAFAGDHRYIVDYLVDEVLAQQPEPVRNFLLQTSILARLTGPLCDAVTGRQDGRAQLDALERNNLFVTPLDDRRRWFRYHHLFADVLRAHLLANHPESVSSLHRRAAAWYAANDHLHDAVRHARAAEDFVFLAALLEETWLPMDRTRQASTWLTWARAIPTAVSRNRPVFLAALGWALLEQGELEAAELYLRQAERWLEHRTPDVMPDVMPEDIGEAETDAIADAVIVDRAQFHTLPATIASAYTYLAQARGDTAGALVHARRALKLLPQDDHLRRGVPASLLSLAAWREGDLTAAAETMVDAIESFRQAGNDLYAITGAYVLADIRRAQGQLHAAFDICAQALRLAEARSEPVRWGTANIYTVLATLHCDRNELDAAAQALEQSRALGESSAQTRWRYQWSLAHARLCHARADWDGALTWLIEAEQHYLRGPIPNVQPVAAWRARIHIAQGRLADARAWVQAEDLAPDDTRSYLREFAHITLARLLIAEYEREQDGHARQDAQALLARLLHAAEEGARRHSVLEILVLHARLHHAAGDLDAALETLARALDLAAPEGYLRVFLDEGARMLDLLSSAVAQGMTKAHGMSAAFAGALLNTSAPDQTADARLRGPDGTRTAAQPLIEPLSERELEILDLIAAGLSNREISQRLFLALSTVKGHNRNIFGKLQVQRRTEAVARARKLGLL